MTDSPDRPSSPLFEDPRARPSQWEERTFDILGKERRMVSAGIPVDTSQEFLDLCEACRRYAIRPYTVVSSVDGIESDLLRGAEGIWMRFEGQLTVGSI
jgi:hypothetical protein